MEGGIAGGFRYKQRWSFVSSPRNATHDCWRYEMRLNISHNGKGLG